MSHAPGRANVFQTASFGGLSRAAGVLSYLGGFAILLGSAAVSAIRIDDQTSPRFWPAVRRQVGWMIGAGLPMVALLNICLGSFLSMQAFYGATFVEAAGPVVGIGLFRNLSPMMAGFVLAALLAARTTRELRFAETLGTEDDPKTLADRTGSGAERTRRRADPARLAAVRIAAAAISGPPLAVLGACVGMAVGCGVAKTMLGVAGAVYFSKFYEMFWVRDVIGLLVKGICFGGSAGAFACHEGLRRPDDRDPTSLATAMLRAAWLASLSVLLINLTWFVLAYLGGPPWGPTVLPAPGS